MEIDGRDIAQTLQAQLASYFASRDTIPTLRVLSLHSDGTTKQFLNVKRRIGEAVGVEVVVEHNNPSMTTKEVIAWLEKAQQNSQGIILQLPLPEVLDEEAILEALPAKYDVDVLGTEAIKKFEREDNALIPPVTGALKEILAHKNIRVQGKHVVVVGTGRLVGRPSAVWFKRQGADVSVANRKTKDIRALTRKADIIVLGAGSPSLLKPDMIKRGAIILDAGTSELRGTVVGDADPACNKKAALFTPTPGGVGPVAVTMIFANLRGLLEIYGPDSRY